jgi:AcrR family transcriptional regulator
MSQARAAKPPTSTLDEAAAARPPAGRRMQTRQALLDAAAILFAERGYHETGVPDIVKAAGVSQGTFYHYFRHRRDVLLALTQAALAAAQRPAPRSDDFEEMLRKDLELYLVESVRNANLTKIWHDAAAYDREIAAMMRDARAKRGGEFAAFIRTMESARGLDADVTAAAIIAMIEEFTYRWFVEGERGAADVPAAADTLSALIMRALGQATAAKAAPDPGT